MKTLLLFVSWLFCISTSHGQPQQERSIASEIRQTYLSAGLGPNTMAPTPAYHVGFSILYKNNWGGSFKVSILRPEEKTYPQGYYPSNSILGDARLYNTTSVFSLLLRRQWATGMRSVKYGAEAGPALMRIKRYNFGEPNIARTGSGFLSFTDTSYNITNVYEKHFAMSFRPYVQFPVSQVFGLELAAVAHLTSGYSNCAVEACICLGQMRRLPKRAE